MNPEVSMQTNVVQAAREVRSAAIDQEPPGREAGRLLAAARDLGERFYVMAGAL
jgi:hypothetical protein